MGMSTHPRCCGEDSGLPWAFFLEGGIGLQCASPTAFRRALCVLADFHLPTSALEGFFWSHRRLPGPPVCVRFNGLGNYYTPGSSSEPITLRIQHINISASSPWGGGILRLILYYFPEFPWEIRLQLPTETTCLVTQFDHLSSLPFPISHPLFLPGVPGTTSLIDYLLWGMLLRGLHSRGIFQHSSLI